MSEQPIKILKRHVREMYESRLYMSSVRRDRRYGRLTHIEKRAADTATIRALIRAIRVLQQQDDTAADLKLALDERETLHARIKELQQLADQTERERDEARAERDARPDISAEDAAHAIKFFRGWDAPGSVTDRVFAALRAHAAKAVKP